MRVALGKWLCSLVLLLLLLPPAAPSESAPEPFWVWLNEAANSARPAFLQSTLYVATSNSDARSSQLFAISVSTGTALWHTGTGNDGVETPLPLGSTVYAVSGAAQGGPCLLRAFNTTITGPDPQPREPLWTFSDGDSGLSTAVAVNRESIVLTTMLGNMYSLWAQGDSGKSSVRWHAELTDRKLSAPAVGSCPLRDVVVVLGENGIDAFDASSGDWVWGNVSLSSKAWNQGPPVISRGVVYTTAYHGLLDTQVTVVAFSLCDGRYLWHNHLGSYHDVDVSPPTVGRQANGQDMVLVTVHKQTVSTALALEAFRGNELWSAEFDAPDKMTEPIYGHGQVFVRAIHDRTMDVLYALHGSTGEVMWNYTTWFGTSVTENDSVPISPPLVAGQMLFFGASRGAQVVAIPAYTATPTATLPSVTPPLPTRTVTPTTGTEPSNGGDTKLFGMQRWLAITLLAAASVVVACFFLLVIFLLKNRRRGDDVQGGGSAYEVLRRLGSGGFGVVYLVKRRRDGEHFAMKYITCYTDKEQESAIREFQVMRRLLVDEHPNMIKVIETSMNWIPVTGDSKDGSPRVHAYNRDPLLGKSKPDDRRYVWIIMPYYEEGDLKRYVLSHGKIAEETLLSFTCQLCSLLHHLHSQEPPLIHRDLKPENILVADQGKRLIVTDFGLARVLEATQCETDAGTWAFLAPECWEHRCGTEADMWGLGCILFAVVTRRVEAHTCAPLFLHCGRSDFADQTRETVLKEGYSELVADLIVELLNRTPEKRPSAGEVLKRLDASPWHPPTPPPLPPPPPPPRYPPAPQRKRWWHKRLTSPAPASSGEALVSRGEGQSSFMYMTSSAGVPIRITKEVFSDDVTDHGEGAAVTPLGEYHREPVESLASEDLQS